jgi:Divergent InlB B-repeat domain
MPDWLRFSTPNPGIAFANWGGACNGTGINPVSEGFTMNANQTVTAEFDQLPDFLIGFSNWTTLTVPRGGV